MAINQTEFVVTRICLPAGTRRPKSRATESVLPQPSLPAGRRPKSRPTESVSPQPSPPAGQRCPNSRATKSVLPQPFLPTGQRCPNSRATKSVSPQPFLPTGQRCPNSRATESVSAQPSLPPESSPQFPGDTTCLPQPVVNTFQVNKGFLELLERLPKEPKHAPRKCCLLWRASAHAGEVDAVENQRELALGNGGP